ncbi:sulfurtransferase [Craterilacuibacter sp. RT1T]|uniref:sulfurtransferase n=1 Tax=Craterilacuibacter sp. RT1T TaxID=2942211 RepID=UPI0020BDD443|nr:sulfurtransferase [Craterilacuibacter sp. RT1T]MCL6263963.1 sulfurtransferase [Craterilacuibacter sp. RT1T]
MYTTLISARDLAALPADTTAVLDCRFQLADPAYGERAYLAGHVPGAHYLHLDTDLSGSKSGRNGRHPLPDSHLLAQKLGLLGIGADSQVVVYDDAGGMFAARAWFLLRLLGHRAVAVLDGGVGAWLRAGGVLSSALSPSTLRPFMSSPALTQVVDAAAVLANLAAPVFAVVDARSPERFRGEGETLDPVGGHIPAALNRFFQANLGVDGCFKPAAELAAEWQALLGGRLASEVVHQCGSGVTACVNLLAMEYAGLAGSRLYPGSWSEWCSDPARPVSAGG